MIPRNGKVSPGPLFPLASPQLGPLPPFLNGGAALHQRKNNLYYPLLKNKNKKLHNPLCHPPLSASLRQGDKFTGPILDLVDLARPCLFCFFFFFTLTLDYSSRVASFPAQRTPKRPGDLALIDQPSFSLTLISPACLGFKSLPLVFFFLLLAQHAACLQNSEETLLDENHTGKKSISFPDSPKLSTIRDHLLPPGILGQTPTFASN